MPALSLPEPLRTYFASKSSSSTDDTLALFASDAVVLDNGEGLELRGMEAIRNWMSKTVSGYKLTTTPTGLTEQDGRQVVRAVVSGNFPGSPYAFDYTFFVRDGKVAELAIDPIGPVEE